MEIRYKLWDAEKEQYVDCWEPVANRFHFENVLVGRLVTIIYLSDCKDSFRESAKRIRKK